jgi:hypothetical protein
MVHFFFCGILSASFLICYSASAIEISPAEAEIIGRGIFFNECGGEKDRLVWWNIGENFASLGIGHFIWYPKGVKGPFEETFPALLVFLCQQGAQIPDWLKGSCPWNSREEFSDQAQSAKKKELQELLSRTVSLQTTFIGKRFESTLPNILGSMSDEARARALKHIERLEMTPQGKFAMIDYLNFKGEGRLETERYQGKGWGLKQVLEEMPANTENSLKAFVETAKALLKQRVDNAPPERQEERWLKGWLSRVNRY